VYADGKSVQEQLLIAGLAEIKYVKPPDTRYLEKYIELQGMAISGYLHLISLYKDDQQYDNIRTLMQEVLTAQGISEETLFIAINALKSLYEYEKIYDLYNGNSLIKDDPILLGAALNALSEEEDYIDFVEEEVVTYFDVLHDDPTYVETLRNVYDLTGSARVKIPFGLTSALRLLVLVTLPFGTSLSSPSILISHMFTS